MGAPTLGPAPGPRPGPRPGTRPISRFVIGTAGHIDHGKTALVKALTGVDTDRWEEEKRRGITIDLGFAPLPLGNEIQASVVDVPGHEGFVRNMLAGATGIDVALLVVAADEGIMPQTEEHLAIVELLGVRRGIPVITKRDLVEAEWLDLVQAEVSKRLAGSRVRWEPPVATSTMTGAGLDELRAALGRVAADLIERPADDLFRLPIDRVFALAGAGTVVTGTTWTGTVAVGDAVRLLPLPREARVRSIEVHGQAAERAVPGRRTALALVGVDKADIARGHVAVTGPGWQAAGVLDTAVELLPSARRPIASRTRLRVHLGTAEVLARVAQTPAIVPGQRGLARLILESPLVARGGDRFVLRSFSPVTTIGGGVVLDPFPPRRSRLRRRGIDADQSDVRRLSAIVAESGLLGLAIDTIPVRLGVQPQRVTAVIAEAAADLLPLEGTVVRRQAVSTEAARLADVVRRHHEEHPLDPGMSLQALRAAVGTPVPPVVIDAVLQEGARQGSAGGAGGAGGAGQGGGFEVAGSMARLPGWRPSLDSRAVDARRRLAQRLIEARWQVPTVGELEREFPRTPVRALLSHLVREGAAEPVDGERYAARGALAEFRTALETALAELGSATPAALRDRFGLTRKYLIPLLEWADRRGVTRRNGDARVLARLTAGKGGS